MDLLKLVYTGALSEEQAQDIFDEQIRKHDRGETMEDWTRAFELSNHESTAYAHGATFQDLAKVRHEGWPITCSRCHCPIDYRAYGWRFVHSEDGVPRLVHLVCPSAPCDSSRQSGGAH